MRKCTLVLLCICAAGCQGASPLPLYLGHVATTSGTKALAGERETWGIRLAVQQLAEDQFQIQGRPLHVKHTDARGQLEAYQGEAVRLATLSRALAIYGGDTHEEVMRLDRVAVPILTPLGYRPTGVSDFVFCTGIGPAQQGQALARYVALEKNVRRAALIVDERSEESKQLAEAFEKELAKVVAEKHPNEEIGKASVIMFGKDAALAKLAANIDGKIQAVLFAGSAGDFLAFRPAVPANVLVLYGGPDGALRGKGLGEVVVASAFAIDKELPQTEAFAQKFREQFKENPDVHASLAYDGIRLVADAVRRAKSPYSERLLTELRQTKDFAGLTGPVSFGKDQALRRPVFVGMLEGAAMKAFKRYDPAD